MSEPAIPRQPAALVLLPALALTAAVVLGLAVVVGLSSWDLL